MDQVVQRTMMVRISREHLLDHGRDELQAVTAGSRDVDRAEQGERIEHLGLVLRGLGLGELRERPGKGGAALLGRARPRELARGGEVRPFDPAQPAGDLAVFRDTREHGRDGVEVRVAEDGLKVGERLTPQCEGVAGVRGVGAAELAAGRVVAEAVQEEQPIEEMAPRQRRCRDPEVEFCPWTEPAAVSIRPVAAMQAGTWSGREAHRPERRRVLRRVPGSSSEGSWS